MAKTNVLIELNNLFFNHPVAGATEAKEAEWRRERDVVRNHLEHPETLEDTDLVSPVDGIGVAA